MPIKRQFKGDDNRWGDCEFVFSGDEEYDYLVTIDSLPYIIESKVDKNHRLLFLGEPPYVKLYNSNFFGQFGHIYGCNESLIKKGVIKKSHPVLPWMLGCKLKAGTHKCISGSTLSYADFSSLTISSINRKNKACLITSRKVMTAGHRRRVCFADYVLEHHSDIIDVYGNGYQSIPDKFEVMSQYKYSIIIENCSYPNYWTEKISDCYLAGCYPLYYGCTNIEEFFEKEAFTIIDIEKKEQTIQTLMKCIKENCFENKVSAIINSRKAVLDHYNMFSVISHIIEKLDSDNEKSDIVNDTLSPLKYGIWDKIKNRLAKKFEILM